GQARVVAGRQGSEFRRVARQAQLFGRGGGAVVEIRSYPRPDVLDFAQVDIDTGVANPFELLEHSFGGGNIVRAALRDFAQVTGELVADALCDFGEPGGRALVVPNVMG